MKRIFWKELLWEELLASFSTVAVKFTTAVPGGSPMFVPIPGLVAAPNPAPVAEPPPKMLPPVVAPVPNPVVVAPNPVVAGLLAPNNEDPVPPKGVVVVVAADPKPPPVPKPVLGAVAVVDPNRLVPAVVVAAPKAGLAPNPPLAPKPEVPKPDVAPPPNRLLPAAGVVVFVAPKPVVPADPKPKDVSHRCRL